MSNRRAAIRRKEALARKIQKNKSVNGDFLRAQNKGWETGKVLSVCTVIDALFICLNWGKNELLNFTDSVEEQLTKGNLEVIEFAVTPWRDKFEQRIVAYAPKTPKMTINSVLQGIEFQHRNLAYVSCCSLMFLNLYSNFSLSSNNKGSGKLDKVIGHCVECFYDLMKNPDHYSYEKSVQRTKELTGINLKIKE